MTAVGYCVSLFLVSWPGTELAALSVAPDPRLDSELLLVRNSHTPAWRVEGAFSEPPFKTLPLNT